MTSKTDTATPNDLSTRAMLVRLRVHRWGVKRNDSNVAHEVAQLKHSNADLGKFTKHLLKSDALQSYRQVARSCRRVHHFMTLPWDEGVGLLPAELYFKYTKEIDKKRTEAMQYVGTFVAEYTKQWNNGMADYKKELGDLFDLDDYPDPSGLPAKFGIEVRTYPIQNPNDFRVKLSNNAADNIKKQMKKDFTADLQEAIRDPIVRLHESLTKVKEKLSDQTSIFRDSLIENVQELVDVLPALNILDDPKITKLITDTDKKICSVKDMKSLREDLKYRNEVAKSADSILKAMKGYVA